MDEHGTGKQFFGTASPFMFNSEVGGRSQLA